MFLHVPAGQDELFYQGENNVKATTLVVECNIIFLIFFYLVKQIFIV